MTKSKIWYYNEGVRAKQGGPVSSCWCKPGSWQYEAWKKGYDETPAPLPAISEWAAKAPAEVVADLKAVNPEPAEPVLLIPAVSGEIPLATSCLAVLPPAVASHLRCLAKQAAEINKVSFTSMPVKDQQNHVKCHTRYVRAFKRIWKRHNTIPVEVNGKYLFAMLSDPGHAMFKHLWSK